MLCWFQVYNEVIWLYTYMYLGPSSGLAVKNPPVNVRDGFDYWVRMIIWRKSLQPTLVFLPGKSHGQRSLGARQDLETKQQQQNPQQHTCIYSFSNSFTLRLLNNIEQSSLCHTVGPCWLSI